MELYHPYRETIAHRGFCMIPEVFTAQDIHQLTRSILHSKAYVTTAGEETELFSIRSFFKEVPESLPLIFTQKFSSIIDTILGPDQFIVKSVYFDRPQRSNWFVPYHQDLTISVNAMSPQPGFENWTRKPDHYDVQPPRHLLENKFTVRIHLDDTNEKNGALRVVPTSHNRGVFKPDTIDWNKETENICRVPAGGVMIMSPLLLHASQRTTNFQRRRVIHIEFCNQPLPAPLQWAERTTRPYQLSAPLPAFSN